MTPILGFISMSIGMWWGIKRQPEAETLEYSIVFLLAVGGSALTVVGIVLDIAGVVR